MLQEPVPTEIKFYCPSCNGIILSDYFDGRVECGHCEAACEVPKAFSEGVIIDDFSIIKRIGTGGMGSVFKAHQISLDREVALKVLHGCFLEDLALKDEFVHEARLVAGLNHKNIVQAYKVGEDCGVLFFAMEHVQGRDLSQYLKDVPRFDEGTVRAIGINIAAALGYAWDKCQLVHRDIKPENIMIAENGDVKLMDLGLSRKDGDDFDEEDRICGTLQYISPEQITGAEAVDICSDIYSLGASLYQLATGKYLFNSADHMELIEMQMNTPAPLVRADAPDVSESLECIIQKMVEKKKSKRYQDTQSLIADLEKVTKDAPVKMKLSVSKGRKQVSKKVTARKKEARKEDNTFKYTLIGLGIFLIAGIIVAMVIVRK